MILVAEGPAAGERLRAQLAAQLPPGTEVLAAAASSAAVNEALAAVRSDVLILLEVCRVHRGSLERMRAAAHTDSNVATASALVDRGGPLALGAQTASDGAFERLAEEVAERSRRLRPRLTAPAGPCVYVRREALELVGALDDQQPLRHALLSDLARRCTISGLCHVLADDVVVGRLEGHPEEACAAGPQSPVLLEALRAVKPPRPRPSVTFDARALDGPVTGTQVNILELVRALAATRSLDLRILARLGRLDDQALAMLRGLPQTVLLDEADVGAQTPASEIFHRPQQAFAAEDVALATRLGTRVVLSQLDLIAYANPAYFPDPVAWENFRRASRLGMLAAERILVLSEHTRTELLAEGLAPPGRIAVVPPGLDHIRRRAGRRPAALPDGTPPAYLLCLGTDFLHKNRVFAMRLLRALRQGCGWEGELLLAGPHMPHGSSGEPEHELLEADPELARSVRELGPVDEEEKAWLLANARAVIYPSTYEGFGLVPFESSLSGVPCIFAAQSSLAEVAPEGAATIVPWEPEESARRCLPLLRDGPAREAHIELLADAARKLTWAAAAQRTIAAYREALEAPARAETVFAREAIVRELQLRATHQADVDKLIAERESVLADHAAMLAELGPGRALVGSRGSLPDDVQRALLALSARPFLARALFGALARVFAGARALRRSL